MRQVTRLLSDDSRRGIAAAVVHHQDLIVTRQVGKRTVGLPDSQADPCFFVIGGDNERKGLRERSLQTTAIHGRCLLHPADAGEQDVTMAADCQDRDISPTRKPTLARASGSCLLFCPLSLSWPKGAQLTHSPHLGYSSLIVDVCAPFPPCQFSHRGRKARLLRWRIVSGFVEERILLRDGPQTRDTAPMRRGFKTRGET